MIIIIAPLNVTIRYNDKKRDKVNYYNSIHHVKIQSFSSYSFLNEGTYVASFASFENWLLSIVPLNVKIQVVVTLKINYAEAGYLSPVTSHEIWTFIGSSVSKS